MDNNVVFNITVCLVGFVILSVHIVNVLLKKERRRDENALLSFLIFTALHFAVYFAFSLIRVYYTSDALIMGFYTGFYIANNLEIFLLFLYMLNYVQLADKTRRTLAIVNVALFSVFVVLDFVNLFTHMFFYAEAGIYVRAPAMIASQGYQFVMFAVVFLVAITNKSLNVREKTAFAIYCFLPVVAIVLQNIFKGYAIAYLSMIVAIEVLFFFLSVQRNLALMEEEKKTREAQIRVMFSQIQPHFIYNSLSSISTLIHLDPDRAQQALDDFTEYLRLNLSSLTSTSSIPFADELRHIETYLSLEQIRFGDRIHVEYDIQTKDFDLPPITIQPIVENAVKHGILQKLEGGTVRLKTREEKDAYVIEVEDDGVGFSLDASQLDSSKHFALASIQQRLSMDRKGSMTIESEIGKGSKIVVRLYKRNAA